MGVLDIQKSLARLKNIDEVKTGTEDFLGFYHENDKDTINLLYLEEKGCQMYGKTLKEIQEAGAEFLTDIMHPEDLKRCVNLLLKFAAQNDESKTFSYFQRLRLKGQTEYQVYFTCVKLNKKRNIFQSITCPITQVDDFKEEVNTLFDSSSYIEKKLSLYKEFSKREKEVIQLVCQGLEVKEIAEKLFLSPHTITKHKKNIYKKSGFSSSAELIQFALSFNLA
ncbi:LuxR C-terminal-related transcriptional regulator [Bernardetia sp. OM2101]|uniref:LuxR C-terminal-related transcriptional regulator n=1 Tax=Bernardetia sp. OM2101 TaxID=3344876 RepID=UPI0035CEDD29